MTSSNSQTRDALTFGYRRLTLSYMILGVLPTDQRPLRRCETNGG